MKVQHVDIVSKHIFCMYFCGSYVIMFMPLVSRQNTYIESDIQIGLTRSQLGIDRETDHYRP